MQLSSFLFYVLVFCSFFLVSSCKSYPIKTYSIPKEVQSPMVPVSESAQSNPFKWELPKGWTEGPAAAMRLAGFMVGQTGAEVTIVGLPGNADVLANVNRWRGQLTLPPIGEADLSHYVSAISHSEFDMVLIDLKGEQKSILAVMFEFEDQTYFVKLMGETKAVGVQRDVFLTFVRSIRHEKH